MLSSMQSDGSAAGFRARGGARDLLSQAQEHEQGASGGAQGGSTRAVTPLGGPFDEQGALLCFHNTKQTLFMLSS